MKSAKKESRLQGTKQLGFSLFSHFVQPDTFRPIAVGVRVGVNVAVWRTAGQTAATLTCGLQQEKAEKIQGSLHRKPPRRLP